MEIVSIIIPVYNVEQYIDQCLESIVGQSYQMLDILLINDGSTDRSGLKCMEWLKKDKRIRYIEKINEGLGPTRNYGIHLAQGAYLAFVDPDDWVSPRFIEKMVKKAEQEDADIVMCDYYHCRKDGMEYDAVNAGDNESINRAKRIIWCGTNMCTKLVRKDFMIKNQIEMPPIPYEDFAVNDLLLYCAGKIAAVKEALYYYRSEREGSITYQSSNHIYILEASQYSLDRLKKKKIDPSSRAYLNLHIYRECKNHLEGAKKEQTQYEYEIFEHRFFDFLRKNDGFESFYSILNRKLLSFGSYNLSRSVSLLMLNEDPVKNRYNFSSIISIMSPQSPLHACHKNNYRNEMILKDIQKRLLDDMKNQNKDYFILDFLEERYDVLKAGNTYITMSEALSESDVSTGNYEIIKRDSLECQDLWEKACLEFIELLKKKFRPSQVILVKMFLCEEYGDIDDRESYKDKKSIHQINSILKRYYDFFIKHLPGVRLIELDQEACFTNQRLPYGVYPWYTNKWSFLDTAGRIIQRVTE